jgi:hypothetical protein
MKSIRKLLLVATAFFIVLGVAVASASAQAQKPNIVLIMGDDIGWMQPHIHHRGLMVGIPAAQEQLQGDWSLQRLGREEKAPF